MSQHMTLSRPKPAVWQISLHSPPDNRLHPDVLTELSRLLDVVEAEWRQSGGGNRKTAESSPTKGAGALIITSDLPKFFSNGLHPVSLGDVGGFFESKSAREQATLTADVYDPLAYRLITFPLVTIAAVNGHGKFPLPSHLTTAFAGGMILALCCDYRVMTANRGMMSMNEVRLFILTH